MAPKERSKNTRKKAAMLARSYHLLVGIDLFTYCLFLCNPKNKMDFRGASFKKKVKMLRQMSSHDSGSHSETSTVLIPTPKNLGLSIERLHAHTAQPPSYPPLPPPTLSPSVIQTWYDTHLYAYLGVHSPIEDLSITDPDD